MRLSGYVRTYPQGSSGGRKGRLVGPNVLQERRTEDNLGDPSPETDWLRKVELNKLTISGGNDEGVPPVPIPNTEVKPFSADGT